MLTKPPTKRDLKHLDKISEVFRTLDAALAKYPDSYVALAQNGECRICGKNSDLRCGVCFTCASQVAGKPLLGGHQLWDVKNPGNTWFVRNEGKAGRA